jgi:hypothetical protein
MYAKSSVAGLLVAVLLAMSSWSSACDLSCALKGSHPGCKTEQTEVAKKAASNDAGAEMDMSHCMHATDANEEAATDQSLSATPCSHDACQPTAVYTAAKGFAMHLQHYATPSLFPASMPSLTSHSKRFTQREYPPPKTASFDPISISLRI